MPSGKRKRARTAALQVQGIGVPVEVRRHAGARRLTLDGLQIVAVGNAAKIKSVMEKYGPVEVYNVAGEKVGN